MKRHASLALLLSWCGSCATDEPAVVASGFDASAGSVEVFVGGDGFVHCAGERMPGDEFVLRMRQRTRAMTSDQLGRFVVHVRLAADIPPAEAEAARGATSRLFDELAVMGVRWAKFL
jgi:hypothetical protein